MGTYDFAVGFVWFLGVARIATIGRAQTCGSEGALPVERLLVGVASVRTHSALSYRHAGIEVLRALQLCTFVLLVDL